MDEETYFYKESDYYTIKLKKKERSDGGPMEALVLDHLIHSYTDLTDPFYIEYEYIRIYEEVVRWQAAKRGPFRALFLGRRRLYLSPFHRGKVSEAGGRCGGDRPGDNPGRP